MMPDDPSAKDKRAVAIKKLAAGDLDEFTDLVKVFEAVFEMQDFTLPGKRHLQSILDDRNFFAVVAKEGETVVGGLTVYILHQYYSPRPLAYIYDLAVATPCQRRGIGRELVQFVRDDCRENGFEEVFVQADKVDDHALDFYRSTGISAEEQVVHFYYLLNKE